MQADEGRAFRARAILGIIESKRWYDARRARGGAGRRGGGTERREKGKALATRKRLFAAKMHGPCSSDTATACCATPRRLEACYTAGHRVAGDSFTRQGRSGEQLLRRKVRAWHLTVSQHWAYREGISAMKLEAIIFVVACATLAISAVADDEWVLEDALETPTDDLDAEDEPVVKEPATITGATGTSATSSTARKSLVKTNRPQAGTSRSATLIVTAAEEEAAVKAKTRKQQPAPPGARNAPSGRRAAAKESDHVQVEKDTTSTSPASLDTASIAILAPKNFKPTPRPINSEEDLVPKGLMEFLRKRKMERIAATTTEDPFVAILATATPPSTEETPTFKVESNGRFGGASKRFRGRNGIPSTARTTTTTTTEPATEAPEVVTSRAKFTPSRFGSSRRSGSWFTTTTTTTTTTTPSPSVDEIKPKFKSALKKPTSFRSVGNSIWRQRNQPASTTAAPSAEDLAADDEAEVIAPVTPRSFRRANARVSIRTSTI